MAAKSRRFVHAVSAGSRVSQHLWDLHSENVVDPQQREGLVEEVPEASGSGSQPSNSLAV